MPVPGSNCSTSRKNYNESVKSGAAWQKDGTDRALRFLDLNDQQQFRAWLGRLNQRRAWLRTVEPYKDIGISEYLIRRLVTATYPWNIEQYPGKTVMLAHVLGIGVKTANQYLVRNNIPYPSAQRAAKWLRGKAAELVALAEELERVPPSKQGFPPGVGRGRKRKTPAD